MPSRKIGFTAELIEGHKGVHAVILPFDPAEVWQAKPVALDDRREGILVAGTLEGAPFEGWIGLRWGRHFIIVDEKIRKAAKMKVGDLLEFTIAPTRSPSALAIAKEQAKLTTAPGRRRK